MRETELLSHIYRRSAHLAGRGVIRVGPGHDCAVVTPGPNGGDGPAWLITVDQLVVGRHATDDTPVDLLARKAVARSVSDLAACAGEPRVAFAAACLPAGYRAANELFDRVAHWAAHWGCPLAGGDIATFAREQPGPLIVSITAMGAAHPRRGPVLRSGARAGDLVCVTGRLGGSFASGRHLTFEPRVLEARWLAESFGTALSAMIDVSDGLGIDAGRLAEMSGVGIEIEESRVPLHPDAGPARRALRDGEDYELLFTVSTDVPPPPPTCPASGTPITAIGRVVEPLGCRLLHEGQPALDIAHLGWDHGS